MKPEQNPNTPPAAAPPGNAAAPPESDVGNVLDELGGENPLDAYLRGGEDEGAEGSEPKTEAPPAADPRFSSMEERLNKAEERAIAAEQIAQQTRGQNIILSNQLAQRERPAATQPPAKEPLLKLGSKEELAARLDKDPAGTLLDLFADLSNAIEGRVTKVAETTDQSLRQRDTAAQYERAYRADMTEAFQEFGEEVCRTPEFIEEGNKEIAKIVRLRGGEGYLPGDFYTAASRVYARMERAGKLPNPVNGAPANANNNGRDAARPSLREITRRVSFSDDMSSNASGGDRGNGAPKSLRDLGLSPLEERIARKNMQGLNITEADWVRNHLAAAREDEGYGR
jgi:hypothetical protein